MNWKVNDRVKATSNIDLQEENNTGDSGTVTRGTQGTVKKVFRNGNIFVRFSGFRDDVVLTPRAQVNLEKI